MRPRATSQSQRARRALNHEAMKRSHRRCDMIRLAPEDPSPASSPRTAEETTQADELAVNPPHS
jgi:hypothetical protein